MLSDAAYEQRLAFWNPKSSCCKSSYIVSHLIRRTECKTSVNDEYVS